MSIGPIPPSLPTQGTTPLILVGALRRRLLMELAKVEKTVNDSGMTDAMTQLISSWQQQFVEALKKNPDEKSICEAHIALLQEMLRDPITEAPLDAHSLLGSDGHVYGQISLAVYRLSMPAESRYRSPLNSDDPTRLSVVPHPVVRHMIAWLESHHALLYSEELEQALVALLSEQSGNSSTPITEQQIQEKVEQLLKDETTLNAIGQQVGQQQTDALGQQVDEMLKSCEQELEEIFSSFSISLNSVAMQTETRLKAVAEQQQDQLQAAEAQLLSIAQQQQQLSSLGQQLASSAASQAEQLQKISLQLDDITAEDRAFFEKIKARIEASMQQGFRHLTDRVDAHSKVAQTAIQSLAQQDRQNLARLQQSIHQMESTIAILQKQSKELAAEQEKAKAELQQDKQQDIALKQAICDLRLAVCNRKKKLKDTLLSTIAKIGVCIFTTWVLKVHLIDKCSNVNAVVMPSNGGGMLSVRLHF